MQARRASDRGIQGAAAGTGIRMIIASLSALVGLAVLRNMADEAAFLTVSGFIVLALCLSTVWTEYRRGSPVSPLGLYGVLYSLHFALPAVVVGFGVFAFTHPANAQYRGVAALMALCSFVAFELGTNLARSALASPGGTLPPPRRWRPRRGIGVIIFLEVTGWLARIYVIAHGAFFQLARVQTELLGSNLHAAVRFVEAFPVYAYAVALVASYLNGWPPRLQKAVKSTAVALGTSEFIYWLIAGRKQEAILILVIAVVVRYIFLRRIPRWRILAAACLVVVLLFPATFYYRTSMERYVNAGEPLSDAALLSAQTAIGRYEGVTEAGQIVFNRLNLLESVSACVRLLEEGEWRKRVGSDYVNVGINFLPRFLWPEKPDYHYGTKFGRDAGFLAATDYSTSVSVTYLGESYLNFGVLGWLVFLPVGFIAEVFFLRAFRGTDPSGTLYYVIILSPLLYLGGTAALYGTGVLRVLILFVVITAAMREASRRSVRLDGALPHGRTT